MSSLTPSQQAAVDFANAVNSMSFDPKEFADQLRREHRTLQQSAFGAFIATMLSQGRVPLPPIPGVGRRR